MKNKLILTYVLGFISLFTYAQKSDIGDPVLKIYKLLSNENIKLKDSLAIYALNFELSISKKNKQAIVTDVVANDSLAFNLFPCYKKFSGIDFSPLMGERNKARLIIPILIYGSSPEKMYYKDKAGNPLVSLTAAVNAASVLYRPSRDKRSKDSFWEVIIIDPFIIEINNIK
ncbi:hypothetical protein D9M68_552170 [compost metagenome]